MKKNKTLLFLSTLCAAIPTLHLFLVYKSLPEQIAAHWNIYGQIDRYANKSSLILLCAIAWVMSIMFVIIPKIDPKKKNYERFNTTYNIVCVSIITFYILIVETVIFTSQGHKLEVSKIVPFLVGVLFVIIGNYMPKCKQNYTFGVRTPWTIDNEQVWNKTHRIAGILYVITGVIWIVSTFIIPSNIAFIVDISTILLSTLFVIVYSYLQHKKYAK